MVTDLLSDREDASVIARACPDAVAVAVAVAVAAGILDPADLAAVVAPYARADGAPSAISWKGCGCCGRARPSRRLLPGDCRRSACRGGNCCLPGVKISAR